jgi:hypothetical protein
MSSERLALLREPFRPNQIGKLPKPTKQQTEEVKADFKKGVRCEVCGQWHHPKVVHLDYVGHAALTDRFLDVDPEWDWKPMAIDANGLPRFDATGGLWILLTICGVTRPGYGFAEGKIGGDATKEVIGDALRNAGMRFGCALDLWHKGDLHVDEEPVTTKGEDPKKTPATPPEPTPQPKPLTWGIEDLEVYTDLAQTQLYEVFNTAGNPELYQAEADKWAARRKVDAPVVVLGGLRDRIKFLQGAASKRKKPIAWTESDNTNFTGLVDQISEAYRALNQFEELESYRDGLMNAKADTAPGKMLLALADHLVAKNKEIADIKRKGK